MTIRVNMEWHGDLAKREIRAAAVRGLGKWGEAVLAASQPLVPVSPNTGGGFLRDSGKSKVEEERMRAVVSYDSPPMHDDGRAKPAVPVAVIVHEALSMHHSHGQAKFLEKPANESKTTGPELVAAEIRKVSNS